MTIDEELRLLVEYRQAYYYGKPLISDQEYDVFEENLRAKLDDPENHPIFAQSGAPLPVHSMLEKVTHTIPMGSQTKAKTLEDMQKWAGQFTDKVQLFVASLKIDGASIAAYYVDGYLDRVATRGDGENKQGEDITRNALRFQGIPGYFEIEGTPFTGGVRLEAVLHVSDWEELDPSASSNPRNVGNGICRRTDGEHADRIHAYAFDLVSDTREIESECEKIDLLMAGGFKVTPTAMPKTTIEGVHEYYKKTVERRPDLDFWIDGIVVKYDAIGTQKELGYHRGGKPKGQIAWKFEAETAETTLRDVVVTGGRTGLLIPNARFDTVVLGGANVSAASLCNWEEIGRLGIQIGDRILVGKMNDIIPKVLKVVTPGEDRKPIPEPTECPFCGEGVGRGNAGGDEGSLTVCGNKTCPIKERGRVKNWLETHNILGMGDAILDAAIAKGMIKGIAWLYTLQDQAGFSELVINESGGRLGKSRASKIIKNIQDNRKMELKMFLKGLGIRFLGGGRAENMMEAADGDLDTITKWMDANPFDEDFMARIGVPGIGQSIFRELQEQSALVWTLIETMHVNVIPFVKKQEAVGGTLCISGKLPSGKKKADYQDALAAIGVELVSTLKKDTTYLVVNDPGSAKAKKAEKYGTKVLNEDELIAMLEV